MLEIMFCPLDLMGTRSLIDLFRTSVDRLLDLGVQDELPEEGLVAATVLPALNLCKRRLTPATPHGKGKNLTERTLC